MTDIALNGHVYTDGPSLADGSKIGMTPSAVDDGFRANFLQKFIPDHLVVAGAATDAAVTSATNAANAAASATAAQASETAAAVSATGAAVSATVAQTAAASVQAIQFAAASGSGDAMIASFAPAIGALVDGLELRVRAPGANTSTTPTLDANALGPKILVKQGGAALVAGDYASGQELTLRYKAASSKFEVLNPKASAPTAGTGIGVSGSAVSFVPNSLPTVTGASADRLVIADNSDGNNPKLIAPTDLPAMVATSGNLRQLVKFTSGGTYSKPSWLKFVVVEMVGGGGGGGASVQTASYQNEGGGGGGGGYALRKIAASSLATSETVTIGDGGAGGTSGSGYIGGNGGTSSFGAHVSATGGGGGGGPADTNRGSWGGGGGNGSGGDINIAGEAGTGAHAMVPTWSSWPPDFSRGGDSVFGRGVKYGSNGGNWFGRRGNGWSPPSGHGGGGNGGYEAYSDTPYSGGAGAAGLVLVWEYE